MENSVTHKPKTLQARIISGSVVLLSGSGLTMAINLAYNICVARYLGPQGFGHATVVYTIITLLSSVTLSFQIISAKMVARHDRVDEKYAIFRTFHRVAWGVGLLFGLLLLLSQAKVSEYLNLGDPSLVALIAIGVAFYIPLGCRRGYLQGSYGFRRMATSLILEQAMRLTGSLILIHMGMGVRGVILANSLAICVAFYSIQVKREKHATNPLRFSHASRELLQALVFFAGQMMINNSDIVLVNHFFLAKEAGLYAAVAMVGRVIFSMSQAIVNSTFPIVAATGEEERRDLRVIATSLMMVLAVGGTIATLLCLAPATVWSHLFGAGFVLQGKYSISYLLALYALTTVIYALGAVIVAFEMSYKIANTSWVQLAMSGVVILAICRFHSSLREVILVQLVLMIVLFMMVALPFLINSLTNPKALVHGASFRPFRLIRRIPEDDVIAEFLKSDFYRHEFREYRDGMRDIVLNPDFEDADQNAKRRALLFIRHLALWKELPESTEWYEVEVNETDLENIRIFPRAQWRKVADGNFSATQVAEGMRTRPHLLDSNFLTKIDAIGDSLMVESPGLGAVIMIGVNENEPLTVLDGNHRLVAAMLADPKRIQKLRFVCGLSARMTECCWYNSNLVTLFRYARNVLSHTVRNPEAELARLLRTSG